MRVVVDGGWSDLEARTRSGKVLKITALILKS